MQLLRVFTLLLALVPVSAAAQYTYQPFPPILSEKVYNEYYKPLPGGFYHFTPIPAPVAQWVSSNGVVLCREMANAISYGKRIALGFTPAGAINDIFMERGGPYKGEQERVCGLLGGLQILPVAHAVRGDDASRKIFVLQWRDNHGLFHYTGIPLSKLLN